MRLNLKPFYDWCDRHFSVDEEWHPWFAWIPVIVEDELVWLEWIETRQIIQDGYAGQIINQEYRNAQV